MGAWWKRRYFTGFDAGNALPGIKLLLDRPEDPRPHVGRGEGEEVLPGHRIGAEELAEPQPSFPRVAPPTRRH
jgi:hypothetical protein